MGSAYLSLGQNDRAQQEFSQAVALDDHLPHSHLNLGVAQLAVNDYAGAEESLQKASSIAPLDMSLKRALAYGELVNKDYPAVIETTRQMHKHKHEGTAVVHYFAAAAWEAQRNLLQAQHELETLLREEPKFPAADQVRQLLQQLRAGKPTDAGEKEQPAESVTFTSKRSEPTSKEASDQAKKILQDLKQNTEIAEAEAAEGQPACPNCEAVSGAMETKSAWPRPCRFCMEQMRLRSSS